LKGVRRQFTGPTRAGGGSRRTLETANERGDFRNFKMNNLARVLTV
jgi:hypothetical protein